jgi:acetate kinase
MTGHREQGLAVKHSVILAVNIGSSSIKFSAYPIREETPQTLQPSVCSGALQGLESKAQSFEAALKQLEAEISNTLGNTPIKAIAHRVVHGGERYVRSVIVTPEILQDLHDLDRLAPLHQPRNLQGVAALSKAFPNVPQVACFDTAFHATLSQAEKAFPLTRSLYEQGIHRYGFHGLSYHYVSKTLARHSTAARGRLLMAHLGNGASLCACVNGKSVATTMGFSAAGGLMMGTRCGDLDPGVMLYLMQQGMSAEALESLFYRQSGLKGMSGISADMRMLRHSPSDAAQFAIEIYQRRVIREAGGLIAAMNGIDAIAFAGGIGENDYPLRRDVCAGLGFLGVRLDHEKNSRATHHEVMPIHAPGSAIEVWVVPTDEEIIAAQEALALL